MTFLHLYIKSSILKKINYVSINVFAIDDENKPIYLLKISKEENEKHFSLLVLNEIGSNIYHYSYIRNYLN